MSLEGHEAAVWGVAIMPEQGIMLTASADKTIKMWKAGKCVHTFLGHEDCVRDVAVLNAGEFLSCSNDATIRHWATSGDCLHIHYGHENFVYSISILPNGQDFVSSSEDRTVRVWKGGNCVQTIPHPTMSVWSVCTLENGDIVSGASDGMIRVFTNNAERMAPPEDQKSYEDEVSKAEVPTQVGDINTEDLPGPEALLNPGKKDGQTKMVKQDGKVELYHWDSGESQWKKIGDVVGSSGGTQQTSGKTLHDGKEYDYVFTVDIEEGKPPLKLPYNTTEDPWFAAQRFLHQNNLSQMFLDQVAEFIMKNAKGIQIDQSSASYADPFTGAGRYVPGSSVGASGGTTGGSDPFTGQGRYVPQYSGSGADQSGGSDPFTGQGRYVPGGSAQNGLQDVPVTFTGIDKYKARKEENNTYFPLKSYVSFDTANPTQIIGKLKEFNCKVAEVCKVEETSLDQLQRLLEGQKMEPNHLVTLQKMICWPKDMVFPALDVLRICMKFDSVNQHFCNKADFLEDRLQYLTSENSAANQMLTLRTLCNMFKQPTGEKLMCKNRDRIIPVGLYFKSSSNKNIQIAVATLLMNYSVSLHQQPDIEGKSQCLLAAANMLENNLDAEAGFRLLVCIGTLIADDVTTKELAQSLELKNLLITLKGNTEPKKVPECASFVIDILQTK